MDCCAVCAHVQSTLPLLTIRQSIFKAPAPFATIRMANGVDCHGLLCRLDHHGGVLRTRWSVDFQYAAGSRADAAFIVAA